MIDNGRFSPSTSIGHRTADCGVLHQLILDLRRPAMAPSFIDA
jgi:hypothetical protein